MDMPVDVDSTKEGSIRRVPFAFIVRNYREEDCREILHLFFHTVHTINAKDYTEDQLYVWATGKENLTEWNRSFLRHSTLVAIADKKIVGFADLDEQGYLDRLFVHEKYQGLGIATRLCALLEKKASSTVIVHASITARPFFEKRGYRVVKQQVIERNEISLINFIMKKDK